MRYEDLYSDDTVLIVISLVLAFVYKLLKLLYKREFKKALNYVMSTISVISLLFSGIVAIAILFSWKVKAWYVIPPISFLLTYLYSNTDFGKDMLE